MSTFAQSVTFCVVLLLQGCGCMSQVTVTNNTEMRMLVDVSLPHPGYGMFRQHCQFSVLLEPSQTWDSRATTSRDRVELPTGQHGSLLMRLINLDREGWPDAAYSIGLEREGTIVISGPWESLRVHAFDRAENELQIWKDDERQWSRNRRRPAQENVDDAIQPRP